MVSLCEGCLGECMLSFDEDVQVFKCFSCLTWCDIPKKSLQKPRARTANSMNRPCEHGGINTCEYSAKTWREHIFKTDPLVN